MGRVTKLKLGQDLASAVDEITEEKYGIRGLDSCEYVGAVKVPLMITQVKADIYVTGADGSNDVQKIFDQCTSPEKKMIWVGPGTDRPYGTGKRFEGYNYFGEKPDDILNFLETHMGAPKPAMSDSDADAVSRV